MPLINGIDAAITTRFIYLLVRPWTNTPAFKLGIIDRYGHPLKKSSDLKTPQERAAYTSLDILVFKLKRLLGSSVASYAAALWLIKEAHKEPKLLEAGNIIALYGMLAKSKDDTLIEELTELKEYNKKHPSFFLTQMIIKEDGEGGGPAVAANNVGSGHIAGTSKQSEPGVNRKRRKSFVLGPIERRKTTQEPVDATDINAQTRKI